MMAINPQLVSDVLSAAAACQTPFDNFKAAVAAYNQAHAALRRALVVDQGGVPLVKAGQQEPITNYGIAAIQQNRDFDFASAAAAAWEEFS